MFSQYRKIFVTFSKAKIKDCLFNEAEHPKNNLYIERKVEGENFKKRNKKHLLKNMLQKFFYT